MSWKSAMRSTFRCIAVVEVGRIGEDECVASDAADVGAGLGVVGVDRAEQCLEHGGSESLGD